VGGCCTGFCLVIEMDPPIIKLDIASLFFSEVLSVVSASLGSDFTFTTLAVEVFSIGVSSFSFLMVTLLKPVISNGSLAGTAGDGSFLVVATVMPGGSFASMF